MTLRSGYDDDCRDTTDRIQFMNFKASYMLNVNSIYDKNIELILALAIAMCQRLRAHNWSAGDLESSLSLKTTSDDCLLPMVDDCCDLRNSRLYMLLCSAEQIVT